MPERYIFPTQRQRVKSRERSEKHRSFYEKSVPTAIPPIIQKIGVLFVASAEMRKHFNLKGIIQNESFVSEPNI